MMSRSWIRSANTALAVTIGRGALAATGTGVGIGAGAGAGAARITGSSARRKAWGIEEIMKIMMAVEEGFEFAMPREIQPPGFCVQVTIDA